MAADVFDRVIIACLIVLPCVSAAKKPLLFSQTDDVVILDNDNFHRLVHDSETFWMVNFYNSWCGHCINFAPAWKDFASDIRTWRHVVRIGAIDCSNDENLNQCRSHVIAAYPTVMFFPPHTNQTYVGRTYHGQRTVDSLRHSLLQYLTENGSSVLPELKVLQPLRSLESIRQPQNMNIKHVVVLFEDKSSFIGQELILDMSPHKEVLIRRMIKEDATEFRVKIFPSLFVIEKDGSYTNLASNGTTRKDFQEALRRHFQLTSEPIDNINKVLEDKINQTDSTIHTYKRVPEAVYYEDLLSAVTYSLTHEVSAIKTIEGQTLEVLKQYIGILVKYLPASEHVISYLKKIDAWLRDTTTISTRLEGDVWLREIKKLNDTTAYIPYNTLYVGCRGSSPQYRGFPCTMWVLFHTLTVVSVTEHSTDINFDPQEVLLVMRGYISLFFGCRECSENFNKGARYIEDRVHKPDDAILYLWIMHNRANYRLHGDITEDPEHPKLQFPPKSLCPQCHLDGQVKDGRPNWDEVSVLKFLKHFYARENIRTRANVRDIDLKEYNNRINNANIRQIDVWHRDDMRMEEDVRRRAGNGVLEAEQDRAQFVGKVLASTDFTSLDLSLCVVFYVVSTAFILGAYFYFAIKRKMRLTACCGEFV